MRGGERRCSGITEIIAINMVAEYGAGSMAMLVERGGGLKGRVKKKAHSDAIATHDAPTTNGNGPRSYSCNIVMY